MLNVNVKIIIYKIQIQMDVINDAFASENWVRIILDWTI